MARAIMIVSSVGIPDVIDVITEINSGSDRVAAVVGGALVDEILRRTLRNCLRQDSKVLTEVSQGSGPLATFSACINMGYLLGLYGKEVRHDLHIIRKIRNEFAHQLNATFSTQKIASLSLSLHLPERFTADIKCCPTTEEKPNLTPESLLEWPVWVYLHDRDQSLKDPRERFIAGLQVIAWALSGTDTKLKIGRLG
ncbi:hypothetical protein [Rhizobium nepotum]|uniref:hypothetical protein n=1 Tax=Rhizobium nepotum TaxID=1035271 RepID=UPI000697A6FB|nr:hypothetical protein [Rhizobium nepotum]